MASITSLMNNSAAGSIYGTRNVLSGLASGMDTETMIENAVSGIKKKIQSLIQKRTKVEWQQEAYRSIIDKAVNLGNKYTSYSSKTNLLSSSFFSNAVITTAKGTYAGKVTAAGKTSSDIKLNAVKQLATAASYTVSGESGMFGGDVSTILGGDGVDLSKSMEVSRVSGGFALQYGGSNGTSFSLSFDELDIYNNVDDLAEAIREKLREQTWTYTKNGVQETVKGSDVIDVQVDIITGTISFSDKTGEGNSVYISAVGGDIEDTLSVDTGKGANSITVGSRSMSKMMSTREYLSDKTLSVSLNGVSKTIKMSDIFDKIGNEDDGQNGRLVDALQEQLDKAFGTNKVTVSRDEESGKMSFAAVEDGSTLTLGGSAVKVLGFEDGDSNYINTGKKLSDLLDEEMLKNNRLRGTFNTYDGKPTEKTTSNGVTYYVDDKGNRVNKDGYRITDTGEAIYQFEINGAQINATGDTTLEGLMTSINSNANAGVKVSYSALTNEFKFTAAETGSNSKIEFGGLAKDLFNPSSGIKSTDSFAEAYGIDMTSRTISFRDPASSWRSIDFNITGDMTEADVIKGLKDLFKEKGLNYEAEYDDAGQIVITDKSSNEQISSWMSKNVSFYDANGNLYEFDITGKTMEEVVAELNEGAFQPNVSDYAASFDEETGKLIAVHRETGETFDIRVTDKGKNGETVEHTIPSYSTYTAGQDAVMDVEINGKRFENLTRSSNNFDIDGMNITVKGTFSKSDVEDGKNYDPVTFETVTDSDKIVDAIRSFVNDYNEMVAELKGAYSTQPNYDSKNNRYEPLTAEEEEQYTESELAAYNEKAKQGILFGDTTLSSMYSKLLNAIAPGGADGQTLREIGISTSYENGLTTISLNEDKLRAALDSNPDKVKDAFAKTREGGSSSDGLMQTLQNNLNTYVKTTGEPKGVLITRAGSVKAPTSLNNNSLNTQINNLDKQIGRWQDKMSSQIDRYTKQFSKLEQLIAAMNSQASAMSGLMGGYEGY